MCRATLATLILLTATRASGADFEELLRRAAEARDAGDAEETLSLLKEAYQVRPLPEVLNNIGRTLEDLGRYDEAAAAYHRVIDDPSSKPTLIALDRERLAALEPKLERGWLLVRSTGVRAFLDGDPLSAGQEIEVPLGPHILEISQGENAVLVFFTSLASRRIEVTRRPSDRLETEAVLDLADAPLDRLFINDRPIGSDLARLRIALPAGTYRLRAEAEGRLQSKQVRIGEGRTLLVRTILDAPKPAVAAETISAPPPRSLVGPLVLGASGLIAAAVGTYLAVIAEQDRDRVRDAERDGDVVTGITMIEAVRLEARANDRATAGLVAFSAGGALGLGAILWWLLDL